jgi:hypothetical protein
LPVAAALEALGEFGAFGHTALELKRTLVVLPPGSTTKAMIAGATGINAITLATSRSR